MPAAADLPEDLRALSERQKLDIRADYWEQDSRMLMRRLRELLASRRSAGWRSASAVGALAVLVPWGIVGSELQLLNAADRADLTFPEFI